MSDGLQISSSVTPSLSHIKAKFDAINKDLQDKKDPYSRIQVYLDGWVQRNFKSEGGKVGGWKPLAAGGRWKTSTSGKRRFDSSAKVLQDTGRLRLSLITFVDKDNVGIGSDVPYSKKHEKGLDGLPVRRMLPKHSEVSADIKKILERFVKGIVNKKR